MLVWQRHGDITDPALFPVARADAQVIAPFSNLSGQELPGRFVLRDARVFQPPGVGFLHAGFQDGWRKFGGRITGQLEDILPDKSETVLLVINPIRHESGACNGAAVAFLALTQGGFGLRALGDVAHHRYIQVARR